MAPSLAFPLQGWPGVVGWHRIPEHRNLERGQAARRTGILAKGCWASSVRGCI